jgi:hypothetical protein
MGVIYPYMPCEYIKYKGSNHMNMIKHLILNDGTGAGSSANRVDFSGNVGMVVMGQSNETGRAPVSQLGSHPQAFYSQIHPSITHLMEGLSVIDKISANRYGPQGGPWMRVYDEMHAHGYNMHMANCSIGSAGWVDSAVGIVESHDTSSNLFRVRRTPVHPSDPGTAGTIIVEDGKVFEMVVGSETYTYLKNNGADIYRPGGDKLPLELDYIYRPNSELKSTAGTKPDFTTASSTGDTVVDGACTWECISTNAASIGYSTGTQFKKQTRGFAGYDPLGMIRRTAMYAQAMRARGVADIYIYICNGQSDVGKSVVQYQRACEFMIDDFRSQGFKVILGLSTYATGNLTSHWDDLSTAVAGALATNAADPGVYAGANLYNKMGITAGQNGLSFNADGVHLDAPAAIHAGSEHAKALKAILPRRV